MKIRCLLLALSFAGASAQAETLTGTPEIVDGDTLKMEGETIRLEGIDALESRQQCEDAQGLPYPCGAEATARLKRLIGQDRVKCDGSERDILGRLIAVCYVLIPEDKTGGPEGTYYKLNDQPVKAGHALAYRDFSTRYVPAEKEAKVAKRGMWAGRFVPPWEWRRGKRLQPLQAAETGTPEVVDADALRVLKSWADARRDAAFARAAPGDAVVAATALARADRADTERVAVLTRLVDMVDTVAKLADASGSPVRWAEAEALLHALNAAADASGSAYEANVAKANAALARMDTARSAEERTAIAAEVANAAAAAAKAAGEAADRAAKAVTENLSSTDAAYADAFKAAYAVKFRADAARQEAACAAEAARMAAIVAAGGVVPEGWSLAGCFQLADR